MHHGLVLLPLLLPLLQGRLQLKTPLAPLSASDSPRRLKFTLVGPRDKGDGIVIVSSFLLACALVVRKLLGIGQSWAFGPGIEVNETSAWCGGGRPVDRLGGLMGSRRI